MNFLLDNGHEMMYNENIIRLKSKRKDDPNAEWNVDQIYADGLPGGKERENTGDIGRLYSGRGEVALKIEVTDNE